MLTNDDAQTLLDNVLPDDIELKAWAQYRDLYLFRVQYSSLGEEDYDPFFSVNSNTGEVKDFSVLTDGDISEISRLDWQEI